MRSIEWGPACSKKGGKGGGGRGAEVDGTWCQVQMFCALLVMPECGGRMMSFDKLIA